MLPNLFVIGAPRSGTTSLYEYLAAHPDVAMSTVKEPDFFARPSLAEVHPLDCETTTGSLHSDAEHHDTLRVELAEYERLWGHATTEARLGEASAVYLGDPLAAWHLRRYAPEARFVVVLRDPAERAHSHFVHATRIYAEHGRTSAVGADDKTVEEEFDRAIDAALAEGMPLRTNSEPEVWVRAGFYHAHLTRWFELFPRDQFAIFGFEDLARDPRNVMRHVFSHIGVDDTFELPSTAAFNASVVPRNEKLFKAFTTTNPVMRRAKAMAPTRVRGIAVRARNRLLGNSKPAIGDSRDAKLHEIYRHDTEQLQELLGQDLHQWLHAT